MSIQSNINSIIGSVGTAAYLMKDLKFKREVKDIGESITEEYNKITDKMDKSITKYGKKLDKSEAKFAKKHPDYEKPLGDYKPAGADDDGYVDFAADLDNSINRRYEDSSKYVNRFYEDRLKKRQAELNLSNEAMKAYQTVYGNRGDSF